ncbi:SUMF1/EgtB/PvdO family nonheme iron enzyme [Bacteroidota bacterium]
MLSRLTKRIRLWTLLLGIVIGALFIVGFNGIVTHTSSDEFCNKCHLHPHSTETWKQSVHYNTSSGTIIHCVDCHLPPKGEGYIPAKIVTGLRDVYGAIFKDSASINWEFKSRPDQAIHFTKDISCVYCHENLYPLEITHKGMDAHLYYEQQEGEVTCIKCHIDAGHYHEGLVHDANKNFGSDSDLPDTVYLSPAQINSFEDYTETIPQSAVSFNMKAIPGGTFKMGAVDKDKFAQEDEFPAREVTVSSFFMGEVEVSWDEYLAWYGQTASEGRTTDIGILEGVDAISGATPPYGNPGQGWGKGKRPAITMTYHAAEQYCIWLSLVTGKKYRLPTEAEWEYAARGGEETVYFFEGDVKDFAKIGLRSKLFGVDTSVINTYAIYAENSESKTQLPDRVKENPYGIKNMLGNVAEFCMDVYVSDVYTKENGPLTDPVVLDGGEEHVVRGGSYLSNAVELRISDRNKTNTIAWLRTDPQIPKSIWWYSDCNHVGFRVVCEYDESLINN